MTSRNEQPLRPFGLVAACALIALAAAPFTGHALPPVPVQATQAEGDPMVSAFIQSGGVAPDVAQAN